MAAAKGAEFFLPVGRHLLHLTQMISARKCVLVLVTAPDRKVARRLARAALQAKLIACANLVPALESHYWWRNRLEVSREVLLLMKTLRPRLPALEAMILELHPYDTPEFLVCPISNGARRYLDWVSTNVGGPKPKPKRHPSAHSRG
jgi:uncharacterized protein involved in tolerance to divalent cations